MSLNKKRKSFRSLHNLIKDLDIYEAQSFVEAVKLVIEEEYLKYKSEMKVKELIKSKNEDDKLEESIKILANLSLSEALGFCDALKNAIEHYKYQETKDWKVKKLKIELPKDEQ